MWKSYNLCFFQTSTTTTASASNKETLVRALEAYFFTEYSMPHIKGSKVRCFLHVFNLGVQDFLSSINCDAPNEDSADQEDEDPTQWKENLRRALMIIPSRRKNISIFPISCI